MSQQLRFIHLLYVPTMQCNMQCTYCYLGDSACDSRSPHGYLETLQYAVGKLHAASVVPFNISLHGGEVTTLPPDDFRQLVAYVSEYYDRHRLLLTSHGFRVGRPHIKTNLFGLDRHIDAIERYDVSVSGSIDLPLSMHRQHRVTRGGGDTLDRILCNVRLMERLQNPKKVSATLFAEHIEHMDEIISDIRYLHENTCLDMNQFNFMIGFRDPRSPGLTPMTQEQQLTLFDRMHEAFAGTDLQPGLDGAWFAEFSPAYCTNCDVCGDKFFLLERSGDVYSCVRGQGMPAFCYGNIYTDSVEDILARAHQKILAVHQQAGFDPACAQCGYLHLCKTGCPFVKHVYGESKSYTCLLQQRLYQKMGLEPSPAGYAREYLALVNPALADQYPPAEHADDGYPTLTSLLEADDKLRQVYADDIFVLCIDGVDHSLSSQLRKAFRDVAYLAPPSQVDLYIRCGTLEALADDPVNNALYIQLLSSNTVVYGDDRREKQEHVMTHMIYRSAVLRHPSDREGYHKVPLSPLLRLYYPALPADKPCNIFFTTTALRDYHYAKQRSNGFYHIRAMNLPFQNLEFICVPFQEDSSNE
ncbi:MAG: radical SAM protein [Clostridia bacterium]|nr:radical SAM protein [Clostridia bacterium]